MNMQKALVLFFVITQLHAQENTLAPTICAIERALATHNFEAAREHAIDFIAHNSDDTRNLGNALLGLGNRLFSEQNVQGAAHTFSLLCALFPASWTPLYNYGFALTELSQYHDAAAAYEKAISIQPNNPDIHVQYALSLIACGDFCNGWREYEWRWQLPDKKHLSFHCPAWDGSNPAGKTILLIAEGAAGDIIQFIRFAAHLKSRGARTIVQIPAGLKPLLSPCSYIDILITAHDQCPPADYFVSLMSAPYRCGTMHNTIPCPIPYIFPPRDRINYWSRHLKKEAPSLTIGLCWHADLANDANRPVRARRSIELNTFAPLFTLTDIRIISLQQDQELADSASLAHLEIIKDLDAHAPFVDTAALIENCDLIITVDTSIAHLAGAMGKPTWVVLPAKADWRWMTDRTDSPWYPTMRLFRKKDAQSWRSLIEEVSAHLQILTKQKGHS